VFGYVPARSLLLRILAPILFNAPSGHLRTLEEVFVDEILNLSSWGRVADTLSLEWQELILYVCCSLPVGHGPSFLHYVGHGFTECQHCIFGNTYG
jgi:hypothetical protein